MPTGFAGLWPRLLAFALDYVLIAAYLVLLTGLGLLLNALAPSFLGTFVTSQYSGELLGFITVTLPVSLYFALSEASFRQATWGKRKLKLEVIRIAARTRVSLPRSLIRTAVKFTPWEISHASVWYITFHPESPWPMFVIGIGIVFLLVVLNIVLLTLSRTHQTLYDLIVGTTVQR